MFTTSTFNLSVDDSKVAKGVAVLLLLWHHLFYKHPEYGNVVLWTSRQASVCVAMFLFLSGYGLAKTFKPEQNIFLFYTKRLWKLYSTYWVIFLVCVPISMLFFNVSLQTAFPPPRFSYPHLALISQFFGLHMFYGGLGFNPTWWFMSAIIPLYFLFPFIYQAIDKYTWWALLVCLVCTVFPGVKIPVLQKWIFPFVLGVFLAKWKIATDSPWSKLFSTQLKLLIAVTSGMLLSSLLLKYGAFIRPVYWYLRLDLFTVLTLIFLFVYIAQKNKIAQKSLCFLGEHSFNVFLIHTFIYSIWFPKYIYACKYPMLIMLALTATSLIFSFALNRIKSLLALAYNFVCTKYVRHGM